MEKDNWCIKVTKENKEELRLWGGVALQTFSWSIGAHYGILEGKKYGMTISWGTILTLEQFRAITPPPKPLDSWCVQVTKENQEEINEWYRIVSASEEEWKSSLGLYYGIDSNDRSWANGRKFASIGWGTVISTEEFRRRILPAFDIKQCRKSVITDAYEIY